MKLYKKVLAGFLACTMIASGIYFVQSEVGSETVQAAEAGEVSSDMLEVKAQIATDGSGIIRFISSVDSLKYNKVGFEVTPAGGTKKVYETTTVYERIVSAPDATSVKYEFGPKVVDNSSEYFVTAKLAATAGVDYTVRAFVQTFAGQMVYGQSRCVALSDGAEDATTINMSFDNTKAAGVKVGDTLTVTYGADNKETTAAVIGVDGTTVHVRVAVDVDTLPSATKFVFNGTATGSEIYRNLYTTHVPASGTEANADTTWYDVYLAEDSAETEFVIATTADLYGFEELVSGGNVFDGISVYLCADLTVNTNTPANPETASSWDSYTAQYAWTPMGSSSIQFKGTLDGEGHSISGLYTNKATGTAAATNGYVGLFACTNVACTVKDLSILDSCFKGFKFVGSITGAGGGTFEGIYSNANLLVTGTGSERVGGVIGNASQITLVKESEFAGTATTYVQQAGGFIGTIDGVIATLQDVRFTGTVHAMRAATSGFGNSAGLCGFVTGGSDTKIARLVANNCLILGEITYDAKESGETYGVTGGIGEHIGRVAANCTYDVNGVYAIDGCCATEKYVGSMAGGYYPSESANLAGRPAEEKLIGANAYANTELGFVINEEDNYNAWIAVTGKVPELKRFSSATAIDLTASLKADQKWYARAEADAEGNAAGTSANPYVINDADDLYGFATIVNGATDNFEGKYIVVAHDITMNVNTPDNANKVESWASYTPQVEWNTIGTSYSDGSGKDWFSGTFDGQNHTISGLYTAETNNERWAGLFGVTAATCNIKNVKLENSYFEANAQVGSIVSRGGGTLENIESSAVVVASAFTGETTGDVFIGTNAGGIFGQVYQSSVSLKDCHFSGTVKSAGSIAGGILGTVNGSMTIEDCSFSGIASTGSGYGAGIVGQVSSVTSGKIAGCTSNGTISAVGEYAGGIAAYINNSDVDVEECVFTGTVTSNNRRAGGIIGFVSTSTVDVATCMTTGSVSTVQRCGGIIGEAVGADGGTATAITMTDCLSAGTTTTTNAGHQQHGGLIGYLLTNATAEATRCVMVGKMVFPSAYPDAARPIVGKVQGTAKYGGAGGVYLINDADYYPEDLGFIRVISLADGNTGWIGSGGAGHSRKTEAELTGADAVTNLPLLQISTDVDGTSTWVATKTGFPILRIFANEADIYTK